MRFILLLLIRIYWLIPKKSRRTCIFKESCSKYVYETTKKYGLKKGIAAFKMRSRQCRPGYYYINEKTLRLVDNSIISNTELRENIL